MTNLVTKLSNTIPQNQVMIAVAIAYLTLPQLVSKPDHQQEAKSALDAAARSASEGDVTGHELSDLLQNEDDLGIIILGRVPENDPTLNAWRVIETAIAFASWTADQTKGIYPSPLVSEVGTDTLNLLRDYALIAGISETLITNMVNLVLQYGDKKVKFQDIIEATLSTE